MNRAKIGLVISVILIIVLAAANVWFYTIQQNQIDTLQNELNDLRSYVSTHSHTDPRCDALTKQKIQLETWLAENMTYIYSLKSQLIFYQNHTSFQNAEIANLTEPNIISEFPERLQL